MQEKIVIGLDIGGTNIDGALVSVKGNIIGRVESIKSVSDQDYEASLQTLINFMTNLRNSTEYEVVACGIGMPNPFDYENGISHMKHKFVSLYGKDIKKPLEDALGLPVYFVNDADAFALGAFVHQAGSVNKLVGVTIGTGLGSGFVDNGNILIVEDSVPPNGEIWDLKYQNGILEDFVSARGIISLYNDATGKSRSPEEIARLAREGDEAAVRAYKHMGRVLGEGLASACRDFKPDAVVIGGKIAQASDLFLDSTLHEFRSLANRETLFLPARYEWLAILGSAQNAFDCLLG